MHIDSTRTGFPACTSTELNFSSLTIFPPESRYWTVNEYVPGASATPPAFAVPGRYLHWRTSAVSARSTASIAATTPA
ncbi:MAG TPA: hypothetical protein DCL73_06330 [Treponema sp.]|nr:hypothetical protein [Treponema sp.]